jgi:hypothetical protein
MSEEVEGWKIRERKHYYLRKSRPENVLTLHGESVW